MDCTYTLRDIDTTSLEAVCRAVIAIEEALFGPESQTAETTALFDEVGSMFSGRFPFFREMDTVYHNLEHTLQATLCWARLFRGYQLHSSRPTLSHRFFQTGLAAVLFHDLGYLKEEHDEIGTGAKFTFVHERRSCELASIHFSEKGWTQSEIFAIQHVISCTGPRAIIDAIPFRNRSEKVLGQMLCTADYLGQMSDPAYPEKLPVLFEEFEESDNYRGIPKDRRFFQSLRDLLQKTPDFWTYSVKPKLDYDCGGLYRYLAAPYPDGSNPYLQEVDTNLSRIRATLATEV